MATATTETLRLLQAYGETRDTYAREQLVTNYIPLVRSLCSRFRSSREPQEDLFQVGIIGLLNAIEKFDFSYGVAFSTLAVPEVMGSILNYLRDHGSIIKVPRALRQKKLKIFRESEKLALWLGRWPTVPELALSCGLSEREVCDAMELARTGEPRSLDERLETDDGDGWITLADLVGREETQYVHSLDRMTLTEALDKLPPRERMIITLRFYRGMSQKQTAERVDISQMHVSRLERGALTKLRLFIQSNGAARL